MPDFIFLGGALFLLLILCAAGVLAANWKD